jgi:predicted DNA-binding transcriptional regulator YafY
MRRADRLLDILQALRGGRLRTGRELAEGLGVSLRTIYRDMETLIGSGSPIEGERGIGYLMREDAFLPPLALTRQEVGALRLGADLVSALADEETAAAFREAMVKVEAVTPKAHTQQRGASPVAVFAAMTPDVRLRLGQIRRAINERSVLMLAYRDERNTLSERRIRPLELEYWGAKWTLTAWCELRNDFRVFRLDRCLSLETTGCLFQHEPGKRISDYLEMVEARMRAPS